MWKRTIVLCILFTALALLALIGLWLLGCEVPMSGDLSLILPEATTNLVANPSVEQATTGYTAVGAGTTIARSIATQMFGDYSAAITPDVGLNDGAYYGVVALTNGVTYTFSLYLWAPEFLPIKVYIADALGAQVSPIKTLTGNDGWQRLELTYTATATANHRLYFVKNNAASTAVFYVDALQVEAKAYATTYCDGDQPDCGWSAAAHASTSSRSAQSAKGGRVVDLEDYGLRFRAYGALGMPRFTHLVQEFALLPGAELQGMKAEARDVTLDIWTDTSSVDELFETRTQIEDALKPDRLATLQSVILRFTGATSPVEIECDYDSGLEGTYRTLDYEPDISLRLRCYDPFWYGIGEHAAALDVNDSLTVEYMAARIGGQWNNLGAPAITGPAYIKAMAFGPDGSLYVGGGFTNLGGIANADYIARRTPEGVWEALGTGADAAVRALVIAPDGTVYAGGNFTTMGGVLCRGVAKWDGAAWSALGPPSSGGLVETLALGHDGALYIGGTFVDWDGIAAGDGIVKWDGSAYTALGAGLGGSLRQVFTAVIGPDSRLYVGGALDTAGGLTIYDNVAVWDEGTDTWSRLSTAGALPGSVYVLRFGADESLYAGGSFTQLGNNNANRVARWTGQQWTPLGAGLDNAVYSLALAPNGDIYVGGLFTQAGNLTVADRAARWNGYAWTHLDANLPGTPTVFAIVARSNGDLYLGFDTEGSAEVAGLTAITNEGSATAYPTITITRSGGASATLQSIRNETTGHELLFNLPIMDGETIHIRLTTRQKEVISSYRGNVQRFRLRASDLDFFGLMPGGNVISAFIAQAGSPTVTVTIRWKDTYWSVDGAN